MGILVRAVAVAAAFTSTSLRERWREPGDEAAAGGLLWAALAGGQIIIILKLCLNRLHDDKNGGLNGPESYFIVWSHQSGCHEGFTSSQHLQIK